MTSACLRFTVIYERADQGWTTASIPAVPGTTSRGRKCCEAHDNVLVALREMLAGPFEVPAGATREDVSVILDLAPGHKRGHDR